MTCPREILPGRSYLVTRRTTQRQFLLRPSRVTNQNVRYCLALAAERTGVILHAVCVMSNHWHGVVTDPEARLPEFTECFHKLLAKSQNAYLDRWENLWSSDKTSLVLLSSEQDVLEKMAYTLANPTSAGLVSSPEDWPGVISGPFADEYEAEMPDAFFDEDGDLPESVELQFARPQIFAELSDAELYARLRDEVAARVRATRNEMTQSGRSFSGRESILRQSVEAKPKTKAPRRNPNPRIAARSSVERIAAIRHMCDFYRAYRAAWNEWRQGNRDATFPAGTYALRIYSCVTCAEAAPG
jgi:REP element-mobilizing transposase RayT